MTTILVIVIMIAVVLAVLTAICLTRSTRAAALLDAERVAHNTERGRMEEQMQHIRAEAERQRTADLEQLKANYETQLKLFREQLATTTEQLLKERTSELQSSNRNQMENIFKPIRDNISTMEKAMNENREAAARNSAKFEESMRQMMERTENIGAQADRLSNALQHKNKTAGNWGELILTELLENQGLQAGVHFTVQEALRDEHGNTAKHEETNQRLIPDVVLHLADNRDVVVDAKMSLTAFVDYQNAETEEERTEAAKRHIDSVQNHINELVKKDYSSYIAKPHASVDFVIMFIPNEGALQLALQQQPGLWRKAFDKKVFIAGSQTLLAALRIIDLTWVNVQQERNTQRILEEARKLVERVVEFSNQFQIVGKKLDEAKNEYQKLQSKAVEGQQSICTAGRRLEELGVRGKKSLTK